MHRGTKGDEARGVMIRAGITTDPHDERLAIKGPGHVSGKIDSLEYGIPSYQHDDGQATGPQPLDAPGKITIGNRRRKKIGYAVGNTRHGISVGAHQALVVVADRYDAAALTLKYLVHRKEFSVYIPELKVPMHGVDDSMPWNARGHTPQKTSLGGMQVHNVGTIPPIQSRYGTEGSHLVYRRYIAHEARYNQQLDTGIEVFPGLTIAFRTRSYRHLVADRMEFRSEVGHHRLRPTYF
jgi:hypothetical protein